MTIKLRLDIHCREIQCTFLNCLNGFLSGNFFGSLCAPLPLGLPAHHSYRSNRPFSSWPMPQIQSKAMCKAIDMRIIFYSQANNNSFSE